MQEGMLVGLGSGTTALFFIESLAQRCREGLHITAIPSSNLSMEIARKGGISIYPMDKFTTLDLAIDGADEIDPQNRMIKGGGGALVREKIIASSSKEMVVLVDESKLVDKLGRFGLPVEIIPFGWRATKEKLASLGHIGELRKSSNGTSFLTDNGNYILDIHFPQPLGKPEEIHTQILCTPGVVDTGFFFHLAGKVLIGYVDGRVEFR